MNDKTYQLIMKILDSDLTKETKDEITRFYLLPRNTAVPAALELLDRDSAELGTIQRPSAHDSARNKNPALAETEDAMKDTLKGRI